MSHSVAAPRVITETPARPRAAQAARAWLRPLLMLAGIAGAAVAALALWLAGGGSFATDDAYIRAAKLPLALDVSGVVQSVPVHEGQRVHRGDVLLVLDPAPFRFAADAARADLNAALLNVAADKRDYQRVLREQAARGAQVAADEADLARFAGLVKSGGVTRAEYDTARFKLDGDRQMAASLAAQGQVQLARLANNPDIAPEETPRVMLARARLNEAERQLTHATLRAPFDGTVTNVDSVQPGQYLGAATAAFGLVSATDLWVEAFPKETELTYARPGDAAQVAVDAYPDHVFTGTLESIAPVSGNSFSVLPAQNASGNWVKVVQRMPIRVHLLLHPNDPALRDGMSVTVTVRTGHKRALQDLLPALP